VQIHLKNGRATWKQDWAEIGGKRNFYRSRWEYRYALYLEFMKKHKHILDWEHEPTTFWFEGIKRGTNNYKPDFKVTFPSGVFEYFEVKGYMDAKSKTKIKRMAKYHPDIVLRIIDKDWFKNNSPMLKKIIPNW
jgi:hypothetical protein